MSRPSRVSRGSRAKATPTEHLCIICAEPILFSAVSPCNNVTCHRCCLRQRSLYDRKTCLVCRTDHEDVIFTSVKTEDDSRYDDFFDSSRSYFDAKYAIHFTSSEVKEKVLSLLQIECPECHEQLSLLDSLLRHAKDTHTKNYCDICATHKKAFVSELKMYNQKQLQKHLNEGDSDGFSGHPRCKFCRSKRFYSEDELAIHIREHHERCHMCDQDIPMFREYFRNYDDLYNHFRNVHYVCGIPLCVEKRFVVFREDLDLTAHMLKEHGGLTGLNGRVVVGATSQLFRSQLSTFQAPPPTNQGDTMDTKRLRFEERARHYLNYDISKISRFNDINKQLRSKRISAEDLVEKYNELFSSSSQEEISLLVYELAELYPDSSPQKHQLESIYSTMSLPILGRQSSFPVLGNGKLLSISNLSWGTRPKGKSQEDLFPTLSKPKRSTAPVIKNAPIRYTVVKKPVQAKPVVNINTFKSNSGYKPTYLDQPVATRSLDSLPALGSSTSSPSSSSSLSRVQLQVARASPNLSKFPTLEKKSTKKIIPRVNPIVNSSGSWGQGLTPAPPKEEDVFGIPIIHKKAEKLKRKQGKK